MDAERRYLNSWSRGLYYSSSVYLYMISKCTSFISSAVGWYVPNKITSTTLSSVQSPHAMSRLAVRETPSGAFRVSRSAREGAPTPPAMT